MLNEMSSLKYLFRILLLTHLVANLDAYPLLQHNNPHHFTNNVQRCIDIPNNMTLCRNVGYTTMQIPNLMGDFALSEIIEQSSHWIQLANTKCHKHVSIFLCSMFAPVCVDATVYPCKSLCEKVKDNCEPTMLRHGFAWPDMFDCNKLPLDHHMCLSVDRNDAQDADGDDLDRPLDSNSNMNGNHNYDHGSIMHQGNRSKNKLKKGRHGDNSDDAVGKQQHQPQHQQQHQQHQHHQRHNQQHKNNAGNSKSYKMNNIMKEKEKRNELKNLLCRADFVATLTPTKVKVIGRGVSRISSNNVNFLKQLPTTDHDNNNNNNNNNSNRKNVVYHFFAENDVLNESHRENGHVDENEDGDSEDFDVEGYASNQKIRNNNNYDLSVLLATVSPKQSNKNKKNKSDQKLLVVGRVVDYDNDNKYIVGNNMRNNKNVEKLVLSSVMKYDKESPSVKMLLKMLKRSVDSSSCASVVASRRPIKNNHNNRNQQAANKINRRKPAKQPQNIDSINYYDQLFNKNSVVNSVPSTTATTATTSTTTTTTTTTTPPPTTTTTHEPISRSRKMKHRNNSNNVRRRPKNRKDMEQQGSFSENE